ncbi:uncharacterized protein V1518DRAFT_423621 [Limtongia smithiae]|uniref:uncharacterized protein n=1 Tax=Limtongia smithiae TaxID=1125753 RepID=UPI0034D00DDC
MTALLLRSARSGALRPLRSLLPLYSLRLFTATTHSAADDIPADVPATNPPIPTIGSPLSEAISRLGAASPTSASSPSSAAVSVSGLMSAATTQERARQRSIFQEGIETQLRTLTPLQRATPITLEKKNSIRKIELRYIWHALFTPNNTHFTLTAVYIDVANPYMLPLEDVKLSMSSGQFGFKGTHRGGIEAMYQLTVNFIAQMIEKGLNDKQIEVMLRGFGKNRTAFIQLFQSRETDQIRHLVQRVSDGTKLRHGGPRAPAHRRI